MIALLLALLAGQEPDPPRLVEALGSDSPVERDRASAGLERLGEEARDALRAGAASANPEVAGRCTDLLARLHALSLSTLRLRSLTGPFSPFGRADHFRVSPDGAFAVGHDLDSVRTWSLPDGAPIAAWRAHPEGARDLAVSPDGSRLLTWGYRGPALWELPSGRLVRRFPSVERAPGAFVASADGRRLGWVTWDAVEWLDAATGAVLWSRDTFGQLRSLTDLALSPDGRRLATIGANSRRIEVLDVRTGALLLAFDAPTTGFRSRIAFTPDGAGLVATNSDHRKAWVFSAETGELRKEAEEAEWDVLLGAEVRIRVVHSRDGQAYPGWTVVKPTAEPVYDAPETWFLTADRRFLVLRTLNGRVAHVHDAASGERLRAVGADLAVVAPSPDGVLAGTRSGEAALYGIDGVEKARIRGGQGRVARVASAGPGRVLWLDGAGVLRCSELGSGRELWRREFFTLGNFAFTLAPDGRHGAGDAAQPGTGTSHLVRFELATGRETGRYGSFQGYLAGVAFSPDGALLAASTRDGPLAVWETESRRRLWEIRPGKNARVLQFTADSASLLAGDDEGRVVRYSARAGAEERVLLEKGNPIRHLALSPDGSRIAVLRDQEVLLVGAVDGALLAQVKIPGWNGVGFRGGDLLAASPVRVLDSVTGAEKSVFPRVQILAAVPDGTRTRVAALFADGRVVAADPASGKVVWEMKVPPKTAGLILGPRAEYAVVHGGGGFKVLRPGRDEPEVSLDRGQLVGSDPAKSVLYTLENSELRRRDLRTFEVLRSGPHRGIQTLIPCGRAPWVLGLAGRQWFRLDAETLEEIGPVPIPERVGVLDVDPEGGLLLCTDGFRDSRSGRLRAALPNLGSERPPYLFLGADATTLFVVDVEGKLFTYGPPP